MPFLAVSAQEVSSRSLRQGWFAGISGDLPFGICTFSSFGADKVRAGWGAGVYAGRGFSAVTSAEVSLSAGRVSLSARDCCVERGYWLGSDRVRYNSPVVDRTGWNYSALKSVVSLLKVDARLNVNLLGFFVGSKNGPWALEVSPAVSAVCSKADLKAMATGETVVKKGKGWNFGVGARLQAGRSLGGNVEVSAYSGLTCLVGRKIDGIPVHQHGANMLWENGLRLGWRFGGTGHVTGTAGKQLGR